MGLRVFLCPMNNNLMQVASRWKAAKKPTVKKSTYAIYSQLCNKHILLWFCAHPELSEANIQAFVNSELERGLSLKTVKDTLLVLQMLLTFGARMGAWEMPVYSVRFPSSLQPRHPLPLSLSQAQEKRLLEHLHAQFSYRNLGLLICLYSGLRIGEVCGLQWQDIDLRAGVIHVGKTVQRIYIADGDYREYGLYLGPPKTASALRDIPLSGELRALLRQVGRGKAPEVFVVSDAAAPLEPRYYRQYFSRLLKRLGLPPVRFHALRHSFATRCIESRCDYKTVSAILGHASIYTTLDLYVHPDLVQKRRCIDKMSRGLRM